MQTKPTGTRPKPKTYTPQERHEKRARQAARAPQTPANVYRQRPYVAPEPVAEDVLESSDAADTILAAEILASPELTRESEPAS